MSYPYDYAWSKNKEAFGFFGPVNKEIGNNVFSSGFVVQDNILQIIRSSIQRILQTNKGERVMHPEFGSTLNYRLFEPNDGILRMELRECIYKELLAQEPRIDINTISVTSNINSFNNEDGHEVLITLSFTVKSTGETSTLRFLIEK